MSDYVRIKKATLTDIADAIRLQKKSKEQYDPADYASIIKAMAVIPAGMAVSELSGTLLAGSAIGVLPTVYKGFAESVLTVSFMSSAVGQLTE